MSLLERIYFFHSKIVSGRYPNATDLADEFEISPATAHRDLAYLRDRLLAPLAYDPKKNGYYYKNDSFRLPFENNPRLILILGMLNRLAGESGLEDLEELRLLRQKLESLIDTGKRPLEDLIHCEWTESEPVNGAIFSDILTGLLNSTRLEIDYQPILRPVATRVIEPLKLVNYQGRWYILSWCLLRDGFRLFHLARIVRTHNLNQPITHKQDVGPELLSDAFGIFKGKVRYVATIGLTNAAADIVRHQQWHPKQTMKKTASGIELNLPVADDRELIMKVLQFGSMARVLHPPELRLKVEEEIRRMARMYSPNNKYDPGTE